MDSETAKSPSKSAVGCADGVLPFFSVVIPTHNRKDLLRETVASVVAQTFEDWEIVIVDDGSAEPVTARDLGEVDDATRVRIFRNDPAAGPSGARNRGAREARGAFLAFVDDDDWCDAEYLAKVADAIAASPEAGAVVVGEERRFFNKDGSAVRSAFDRLEKILRFRNIGEGYLRAMRGASGLVVRKKVFDAVGGFDESMWMMEDWDLCIRLIDKEIVWAAVADPVMVIRMHEEEKLSGGRRPAEIATLANALFEKNRTAILRNKGLRYWIRKVLMNHWYPAGDKSRGRAAAVRLLADKPWDFKTMEYVFRFEVLNPLRRLFKRHEK